MADRDSGPTIDFGFEQVPLAAKAERVAGVFRSVAGRYDVMNDLMSLGTHRIMKWMTLEFAHLRPGQAVLDVAGGTGDMTKLIAPRVGDAGRVVLTDINEAMLGVGRDRLLDAGIAGNVDYAIADAERLPFADASFDLVVIAFGLRNVTVKERALESFQRVLKPGGRLLVLEFSRPPFAPLEQAFSLYTRLWPPLGQAVVGDADSYRYLRESIEMMPRQSTLAGMFEDAGFEGCRWNDMLGGIVALHRGDKPRAA